MYNYAKFLPIHNIFFRCRSNMSLFFSLFQSSPAVLSTSTAPPSSSISPNISIVTVGRAAARKARDRLHTLITQLRPPEEDTTVTMETESQGEVADGDLSSSATPTPSGEVKMWKPTKTNWADSAVTPQQMKELRKKFRVSEDPMTCPMKVCLVFSRFVFLKNSRHTHYVNKLLHIKIAQTSVNVLASFVLF